MKRMVVALALLVSLGLQARTYEKLGIQHKIPSGCFNAMYDEINDKWLCEAYGMADSPTSNCSVWCPLPCTYQFETPLYFGPCTAKIELCNKGEAPARPICQCDGHGLAPSYLYGQKHLMYQ